MANSDENYDRSSDDKEINGLEEREKEEISDVELNFDSYDDPEDGQNIPMEDPMSFVN